MPEYANYNIRATGPYPPGSPINRRDCYADLYAFITEKSGAPPGKGHDVKWYDWLDDLIAFSSQHPNLLFEVERIASGSGDPENLHLAYCLGGKTQLVAAQISYPPFDEFKLS